MAGDGSLGGVPELLTVGEAYRAAFHLVDQYVAREQRPDEGLILLWQYLKTDPARWSDWLEAVRRAVDDPGTADPQG